MASFFAAPAIPVFTPSQWEPLLEVQVPLLPLLGTTATAILLAFVYLRLCAARSKQNGNGYHIKREPPMSYAEAKKLELPDMPGWRADPSGFGYIRLPPPPEGKADDKAKELPAWAHSPLASDAEAMVIAAARKLLKTEVVPAPDYLDLQLLRHLRAMGGVERCTDEQLAAKYKTVWEWKCQHLQHVDKRSLKPNAEGKWPAQADLTHGKWFTQHGQAGLRCGRSHGGHQVKIERGGLHNFEEISKHEDGMQLVCEHYYHLLESTQYSLDAESAHFGRLLQDYEVFDFQGLSLRNCNVTTLRISARLAAAFTQNYPECIAKTCVINLPSWAIGPMNMLLTAMPSRVRDKVSILGEGETEELLSDVDSECARLLFSDRATLTRHRGEAKL